MASRPMGRGHAAERPAPFCHYLAYSETLDEPCYGGDRGHDHGPELDGQPKLQFPQIGLGRHLGLHMGFGKRLGDGLGLLLRNTGLAQLADELAGIEGDGGHDGSQHSDERSSGSTSMLSYAIRASPSP